MLRQDEIEITRGLVAIASAEGPSHVTHGNCAQTSKAHALAHSTHSQSRERTVHAAQYSCSILLQDREHESKCFGRKSFLQHLQRKRQAETTRPAPLAMSTNTTLSWSAHARIQQTAGRAPLKLALLKLGTADPCSVDRRTRHTGTLHGQAKLTHSHTPDTRNRANILHMPQYSGSMLVCDRKHELKRFGRQTLPV